MKIATTDSISDAALSAGNILTPELAGYKAEESDWGDALCFPGGFCVSIKMVKAGAPPKCMRCWTNPLVNSIPNLLDEMRQIADGIQKRRASIGSYFAHFVVTERMINVRGTGIIPGIVMDWIEGESLIEYVMNPAHKSADLQKVAVNFMNMCIDLRTQGVSHGDLSGSNILIKPGSTDLLLIDYDSVYFNDMGRKPQIITGVADYQHPDRESHRHKEVYSDYFSQHIIFTSLLIYAANDKLRPYGNQGQRNLHLFFTREDLTSAATFRTCNAVRQAKAIGNAIIDKELTIIAHALAGKYEQVPPLLESVLEKPAPKVINQRYIVRYCTGCGNRYTDSQNKFMFCPACGTPRHSYTAQRIVNQ